jgi:hypothetical protein
MPLATTTTSKIVVNGKEVHDRCEIVVYARSAGGGRRMMDDWEFRNV